MEGFAFPIAFFGIIALGATLAVVLQPDYDVIGHLGVNPYGIVRMKNNQAKVIFGWAWSWDGHYRLQFLSGGREVEIGWYQPAPIPKYENYYQPIPAPRVFRHLEAIVNLVFMAYPQTREVRTAGLLAGSVGVKSWSQPISRTKTAPGFSLGISRAVREEMERSQKRQDRLGTAARKALPGPPLLLEDPTTQVSVSAPSVPSTQAVKKLKPRAPRPAQARERRPRKPVIDLPPTAVTRLASPIFASGKALCPTCSRQLSETNKDGKRSFTCPRNHYTWTS